MSSDRPAPVKGKNEAPAGRSEHWRGSTRSEQLLPGQSVEYVTIIGDAPVRNAGTLQWLCKGLCGHVFFINHTALTYAAIPACSECASVQWNKSNGLGESDAAFEEWISGSHFAVHAHQKPKEELEGDENEES